MEKVFKALKKIGNLHSVTKGCAISHTDEYKVIEQALIKAEKLEKAIDILKEYFEIQIVETDSKEMATICISRKDCKTMLHFAQTIIRDKEKINTLKEVLE